MFGGAFSVKGQPYPQPVEINMKYRSTIHADKQLNHSSHNPRKQILRTNPLRIFCLLFMLSSFGTANLQAGKPATPSAPSSLASTAVSSSQINLTWRDNSSNESGFIIQRGSSSAGPWTQIATVGAGATSFSNTGLGVSTAYYYRVCAYNSRGNSSYSNTAGATTQSAADTTAPSVPTGLTTTAASSSQINLSWSAATDAGGSGLAGYKIYRSGVQIGTSATTSYSNSGLSASTTYCYTVAAYDNAGNNAAQGTQACAATQSIVDLVPPTAVLTAPIAATTVSGTITLAGNA